MLQTASPSQRSDLFVCGPLYHTLSGEYNLQPLATKMADAYGKKGEDQT